MLGAYCTSYCTALVVFLRFADPLAKAIVSLPVTSAITCVPPMLLTISLMQSGSRIVWMSSQECCLMMCSAFCILVLDSLALPLVTRAFGGELGQLGGFWDGGTFAS